jgi:pimeloyl-ACP methyl ester carboxylesterase
MNGINMKAFVLVHGAWHGGWVWRDVAPRLRALGHTVTAPTLTGLGERRHLAGTSVDLDTHITDIVTHIEMEGFSEVILVGWSYGGVVTTAVRTCIPDKISRMIYLDAIVPDDGKAAVDYSSRTTYDQYKNRDEPVPPPPLSVFGVTDPSVLAFVQPRLVPHPWRTAYQPVHVPLGLPNVPEIYIACTGRGETSFSARVAEMRNVRGKQAMTIDADHLCMLTAPDATVSAISS